MQSVFAQLFLGGCLVFFLGCVTPTKKPGGSAPTPKPQSALDIIKNKVIWGADISLAVAYLEALEKTGAKTVALFPNALVQSERFAEANQARSLITKTNAELNGADQLELFKKVQKNLPFQSRTAKVETVKLMESDSLAVGINFNQASFFKANTKIATVQKELGPPEQITHILIEGRGEERPIILTLYGYSQGAFRFAVADIAAEPGMVDRVYLNVPTLVKTLKRDLK